MEVLDTKSVKTIVQFKLDDMHIFHALKNFFVDISTFHTKKDFLDLRQTPLYPYSENEILILNTNFFVDKIYQVFYSTLLQYLLMQKLNTEEPF